MGVAGSGKTTVGQRLAADLGWPYFEADDFHPAANKTKMSQGLPLDDADRAPWLAALRVRIEACLAAGQSAVFTCSALKEQYRQVLVGDTQAISLVFLAADFATIQARVRQRAGHFMKADLVQSQFDALEAPANALTLDARQSPDTLVAEIRQACAP
jgi:gluconokinase